MPVTGTALAGCASCETVIIDAAASAVAVIRCLHVLLRFMTWTPQVLIGFGSFVLVACCLSVVRCVSGAEDGPRSAARLPGRRCRRGAGAGVPRGRRWAV